MDGRVLATATPTNGVAVLNLKALPAGLHLLRAANGRVARVVKE